MRTALAITLLAGWVLLAACGGDDDETTSPAATAATGPTETTTTAPANRDGGGDGDLPSSTVIEVGVPSPSQTIELVLTSGDPKQACEELVTQDFVNRAYGGIAGCRAAIEGGGTADSVKVSDLERDGETATAVSVPEGGPNSGEDIDVRLVREDGTWKVDDLHSNVPAGP